MGMLELWSSHIGGHWSLKALSFLVVSNGGVEVSDQIITGSLTQTDPWTFPWLVKLVVTNIHPRGMTITQTVHLYIMDALNVFPNSPTMLLRQH